MKTLSDDPFPELYPPVSTSESKELRQAVEDIDLTGLDQRRMDGESFFLCCVFYRGLLG
jgi:hypothetical protein